MKAISKQFSHVSNFTPYMAIVEKLVNTISNKQLKILDLPAGNGLLAARLRGHGHEVICADINAEHPEYVFANLESSLPFSERSFDLVICLEGIEHVTEPYHLIKELCRIAKPDGHIIISQPNVQSFFSRLRFLFTGMIYQFDPEGSKHPEGRLIDRGHISPLTLVQMSYLFGELGWEPFTVTGDGLKKKILFPLYLILWLINVTTIKWRHNKCTIKEIQHLYTFLTNFRSLTSRSLITAWIKTNENV